VQRDELEELHYITHVGNLASIAKRGILCHKRAARIDHEDVSMAEVQGRRRGVRVPNGLLLHDYANLYVTARNPMLNLRLHEGLCDELCVIAVSTTVLDLPDVVITDRNAAASLCRFRPVSEGLAEVDGERVNCRYWPHHEPLEEERRRNAKFTEVLVPGRVAPEFLQGVYVGSTAAETVAVEAGAGLPVSLNRYLFFKS
jgi:hypothetical protein